MVGNIFGAVCIRSAGPSHLRCVGLDGTHLRLVPGALIGLLLSERLLPNSGALQSQLLLRDPRSLLRVRLRLGYRLCLQSFGSGLSILLCCLRCASLLRLSELLVELRYRRTHFILGGLRGFVQLLCSVAVADVASRQLDSCLLYNEDVLFGDKCQEGKFCHHLCAFGAVLSALAPSLKPLDDGSSFGRRRNLCLTRHHFHRRFGGMFERQALAQRCSSPWTPHLKSL